MNFKIYRNTVFHVSYNVIKIFMNKIMKLIERFLTFQKLFESI